MDLFFIMDIYEKLQQAGLTGNEARVYLELLKKGELSANQIAKNIGMDRTLTYTVLNNLIEKGQVNYAIRENKKFFSCSIPDNLINSLKTKEFIILNLIKELKTIKKEENKETEINIYEGRDAIRNMYALFKKYKEILSFGATGRAYDYLYESPALVNELLKENIYGRIITSKKYKMHSMTRIKNITVKYVNYESEATTTLFGDYVMIHLAKNNPLIILIKNKDICDTYRKHFELLWKNAKSKSF